MLPGSTTEKTYISVEFVFYLVLSLKYSQVPSWDMSILIIVSVAGDVAQCFLLFLRLVIQYIILHT